MARKIDGFYDPRRKPWGSKNWIDNENQGGQPPSQPPTGGGCLIVTIGLVLRAVP